MAKRVFLPLAASLALLASGCESGPHSSTGFRLPPGGNAQQGKVAFVKFGCHKCHEVIGSDLPKPVVQPPVPVALGGVVDRQVTDGYLVASIIYPSYQLAPYPKAEITTNGQSRMPHFTDVMTVQQLTDLVAFLQSQYVVQQPPAYWR